MKSQGFCKTESCRQGKMRGARGEQRALHCPQFGPVLQGFGDVNRLDFRTAMQVCDGARQFEYPVVGAGRKVQLAHSGAHQGVAVLLQAAEFPHFGGAHLGVAADVERGEARGLSLPRPHDALPDDGGGFSQALAAQFLVFHPRDFDVNVNAVQQRPGDALLVVADGGGGAGGAAPTYNVIAENAYNPIGKNPGDEDDGQKRALGRLCD